MSLSNYPAGEAPVIETDRLIMRGPRISDFDHCAAMWADPDVVSYITGTPLPEEDAWNKFLRATGHWAMMGFGYWMIEEKATGRFIGEVGFADFKRAIDPSIKGIPEIGWVLVSAAQGKGFASEAVRAALTWGEAHFLPVRTVCLIDPDNAPSIRLAGKFGYEELTRTTYKDHPIIIFQRPQSRAGR